MLRDARADDLIAAVKVVAAGDALLAASVETLTTGQTYNHVRLRAPVAFDLAAPTESGWFSRTHPTVSLWWLKPD
jgi:hypothetical protein